MDNYQLVVGNEECPLNAVAPIVRQSSAIQNEWSTFARRLDVSSEQIKRLRQSLQLDKITYEDLVFEVLEIWRAKNGSKATLVSLLWIVEEHCGANDVGELLRLEYKLPCKEADSNPSIEWKNLSPAFQKRAIETFQYFTPNLKYTKVLQKLTGPALVSLMKGKKPHILSLPEELSYYVNRTIVTRNVISEKIVDQNSPDIFLFTGAGVDRYKLSTLAKDKLTGGSRQQLEVQGDFNVKFMMLDQSSHFDRICGKTNHAVHLLRKGEGDEKLRWIKSKGGMDNLRKYIDQKQDELDEDQFCKISDSQSTPVLICDTPGMGKSVLLAQIGHRLNQLYPDRTVHFIELSEFIKLAKSFGVEDKPKMIELILKDLTGEALSQAKLNLNEEKILIELLLDGYDEVDSADRPLALDILQTIRNSFKFIRLWITSRPHLLDELENNLEILGYDIRPFHEDNQVHFLSSFWSRKVQLEQEKVQLFAKHCLKSLKAKMNSTDNDIAGIPLQCLLIGEVYEDDAVEYAKVGKNNTSGAALEVEIGTITNLYRQLVKNKFKKYKSAFGFTKLNKHDFKTIHSQLSLEVLFPWEYKNLRLGLANAAESTYIEEVMMGGIATSTRLGAVTFMHRTFAEYFVAWFIYDKVQQEEKWTPELVGLFYKVLGCSRLQRQTKFEHPVICYFFNSMIANLQIENVSSNSPYELDEDLQPEDQQLEDLKIAVACVTENYVHIFNMFNESRSFENHLGVFFDVDILLLGVRNSSVELLESVLTHFERHHSFNLDVQKKALREAVKQGKFSILEFLIKEKQLSGIVENFKNTNLVNDCIVDTMNCTEGQIKERILVLKMLVGIKSSLLDGLNGSSATAPLLSKQVHVDLLIELVRLGADVFVLNGIGDTVLHLGKLSQENYHKLVTSIPSAQLKELVNVKGALLKRDTPLMALMRKFDPLPETLNTFHDVGADFNHVNEEGESVLEVAIKNGRKAGTIRKLLHLGAQVQVQRSFLGFLRPSRKTTLLHVAAKYVNVDVIGVLIDDCTINVNAKDEQGLTPLDHAICDIFKEYTDEGDYDITPIQKGEIEVCFALIERGGDVNLTAHSMTCWLLHFVPMLLYSPLMVISQLVQDENDVADIGKGLAERNRIRSGSILSHSYLLKQLVENAKSKMVNEPNEMETESFKAFRLLKSKRVNTPISTPTNATLELRYAVSGDDAYLDTDFETLAQECITLGANLKWVDEDGNSLLHLAASNGKVSAVKFLIKKGLDVNLKNKLGRSPLQKAASSKQSTCLEVIVCLIENGADAEEITDFGENILHLAAWGNADALKYFLEYWGKEMDINRKDSNGGTPLHCAVDPRNDGIDCVEKCRLLIQHGADANISNCDGYTPLTMAMKHHGKNELLITLLRQSSNMNAEQN